MIEKTDEELVALAKSGNIDALDILLARYKSIASQICRSYFLIGAEQDDLMQEAMIGLYKACISYDETNNTKFSTFARLCITRNIQTAVKTANRLKNRMLNNSVRLSNQGKVSTDDDESQPSIIIPATTLSPADMIEEAERLEEIKIFINKTLSPFERKVLNLYLTGCTYTQIALEFNKTPKAIDNALFRIKQKLMVLKK